jgi:hypothetical protein
MGEVVSLAARREDNTPHAAGPARCIACKHEWVAVVPAGTTDLRCPSCDLVRGQWVYPFSCAEGEIGFACKQCSSENVFVRLGRVGDVQFICVGCGVDLTQAIFAP